MINTLGGLNNRIDMAYESTNLNLDEWKFSHLNNKKNKTNKGKKSYLFVKVLVTQSCPTLCYFMDCGPSGSSVHGILQARILEWVAMPFSRGSSQPRDQTLVSCIAGRFFTIWGSWKAHNKTLAFLSWNLRSRGKKCHSKKWFEEIMPPEIPKVVK